MKRPYVFCHMMASLDGKIMGSYMETPEGHAAWDVFYNIAFGENPYYKHQGWLSGRVTTDDNFTNYRKPDLEINAPPVPAGDYIAQKADMYYVSIDPSGTLGWEDGTVTFGEVNAHVIEVLTSRASNDYKAFLRRIGVSYLVFDRERLDFEVVLKKLKALFGIETLMLGGGAVLNWSFLQSGLCDEVSVVITAAADGSTKTPTLFSAKEGLSESAPISFDLQEARIEKGSSLWLRYLVK